MVATEPPLMIMSVWTIVLRMKLPEKMVNVSVTGGPGVVTVMTEVTVTVEIVPHSGVRVRVVGWQGRVT